MKHFVHVAVGGGRCVRRTAAVLTRTQIWRVPRPPMMFGVRSPGLLAPTLVTLPSMSRVPGAPFFFLLSFAFLLLNSYFLSDGN